MLSDSLTVCMALDFRLVFRHIRARFHFLPFRASSSSYGLVLMLSSFQLMGSGATSRMKTSFSKFGGRGSQIT